MTKRMQIPPDLPLPSLMKGCLTQKKNVFVCVCVWVRERAREIMLEAMASIKKYNNNNVATQTHTNKVFISGMFGGI